MVDASNRRDQTDALVEQILGDRAKYRVDDDGYCLVDENRSTLVLVPRDGPLDEADASSLSAGAQGYGEVRKNLRDSVTGRDCCKPELDRSRKRGAQNVV